MRKIPLLNLYLISGKELQKQKEQQKEQQESNMITAKVLQNLFCENFRMREICKRYGHL